jgi:hypothetical protein
MNPGITEEVGETSRSFMAAMGSQPVMLGMVIVVLAMIAMLWFTLQFAASARKNEFELIFKQQSEFAQLLARCTVQPSSSAPPFKLQSDESRLIVLPPKSIVPPASPPAALDLVR